MCFVLRLMQDQFLFFTLTFCQLGQVLLRNFEGCIIYMFELPTWYHRILVFSFHKFIIFMKSKRVLPAEWSLTQVKVLSSLSQAPSSVFKSNHLVKNFSNPKDEDSSLSWGSKTPFKWVGFNWLACYWSAVIIVS